MVSRHFSVKLSLPSILSLKKTESDEFVSLNFNKFNYNNIDDNDINNNSKVVKYYIHLTWLQCCSIKQWNNHLF